MTQKQQANDRQLGASLNQMIAHQQQPAPPVSAGQAPRLVQQGMHSHSHSQPMPMQHQQQLAMNQQQSHLSHHHLQQQQQPQAAPMHQQQQHYYATDQPHYANPSAELYPQTRPHQPQPQPQLQEHMLAAGPPRFATRQAVAPAQQQQQQRQQALDHRLPPASAYQAQAAQQYNATLDQAQAQVPPQQIPYHHQQVPPAGALMGAGYLEQPSVHQQQQPPQPHQLHQQRPLAGPMSRQAPQVQQHQHLMQAHPAPHEQRLYPSQQQPPVRALDRMGGHQVQQQQQHQHQQQYAQVAREQQLPGQLMAPNQASASYPNSSFQPTAYPELEQVSSGSQAESLAPKQHPLTGKLDPNKQQQQQQQYQAGSSTLLQQQLNRQAAGRSLGPQVSRLSYGGRAGPVAPALQPLGPLAAAGKQTRTRYEQAEPADAYEPNGARVNPAPRGLHPPDSPFYAGPKQAQPLARLPAAHRPQAQMAPAMMEQGAGQPALLGNPTPPLTPTSNPTHLGTRAASLSGGGGGGGQALADHHQW